MLDDKGRLFGKVSLVDLFAVVILIAVFFVVYVLAEARNTMVLGQEEGVYITFHRPVVADFVIDHLKVGAPISDHEHGTQMGQIVEIRTAESVSINPDAQGNEKASPKEGHSAVWITARVNGRMYEGAVVLDGRVYVVGSEVFAWMGTAWLIADIIDISTIIN